MLQTVEVRFKGTRRGFFRWTREGDPLRLDEAVIVPVERGLDLGRVTSTGAVAEKKCGSCGTCDAGAAVKPPTSADGLPEVVRRAEPAEVKALRELRKAEEDDRRRVVQKVREHRLDMKVSDVEWQWDRQRVTVYFTAEQRVDFRALVRDLAGALRARIELRQIGVRDEAARVGGVGRCGREYCCATWLTELSPVNLALAKDQRLSLNPSQISGGCGRLLCCLKYEHDFYAAARRRFPKEGKLVQTARGAEKVIAVDIFRERVFLRGAEEARTVTLVELLEEQEQAAAAGLVAPTAAAAAPAPRTEGRSAAPRRESGTPATGQRGAGRPARDATGRDGARRDAAESDRHPTSAPPDAAALPVADGAAPALPSEAPRAESHEQVEGEGAAASPARKRRRRRRRGPRRDQSGAPEDAE
jgi:cell fate regulator YaaT (PSP1 superfamily)